MTTKLKSQRNIFDLDPDPKTAEVQILGMPFDATTSYRPGASKGPRAIFKASFQVDLCDADVGEAYKAGINMAPLPDDIIERNQDAREAVQKIREAIENDQKPEDNHFVDVNEATQKNNEFVYDWTKIVLAQNKLPVVLGGDHSVPFGAIKACAEHLDSKELGILHIDAHCDLRKAYEGFGDSHASIMYNVLAENLSITKLTQVGIRDFSQEELNFVQKSKGRVSTFFDKQIRPLRLEGKFQELCPRILDTLPQNIYLSFDIDGLDPVLCPNTGTPVPGGLSFDEATALLSALASSGKRVVGMDLCEVSPPPGTLDINLGSSWDANVGARILYKMIGFSLISRQFPGIKPPSLPTW